MREKSSCALAWLRDKPPSTKCVTSKASVLNNFSLAFEEDCSDYQVSGDSTPNTTYFIINVDFFRKMTTESSNAALL